MEPVTTLNLDGEPLSRLLGLPRSRSQTATWRFTRALPHHEGGTLLSFERPGSRQTIGLQVRLRDDERPAWKRTAHLDCITHIPEDIDSREACARLEPIVAQLRLLDGPQTSVVDATPQGDPPPPVNHIELPPSLSAEAPSPFGFGKVFVLDLQSDCGQRCSFCSTRTKMSPQLDFSPRSTRRLVQGMTRARTDGYDVLRISGLDPLTHPDILDLISEGDALGFKRIHLYTPGRRLSEDAFFNAFQALRARINLTLHIPLYGSESTTHDRVVGVPGAFKQVLKALRALSPFEDHELILLTVVTHETLGEMAALRALFSEFNGPVQVFVPFPSTRDPEDAFFKVALRHDAMVEVMARCDPPMGLSELLPCVRFRHEQRTGMPTLTDGGFHPMNAALGTLFEHGQYRRVDDEGGNTFTIPVTRCPEASACALAPLCPRSVYTAYAERFGLDELRAVSADELSATAPSISHLLGRR